MTQKANTMMPRQEKFMTRQTASLESSAMPLMNLSTTHIHNRKSSSGIVFGLPSSEHGSSHKEREFNTDSIGAVLDADKSIVKKDINQSDKFNSQSQNYYDQCKSILFDEDEIACINAVGGKYSVTVTSINPPLNIPLGTTDGLRTLNYYRNKTGKEPMKRVVLKEYYDYLTEYVKNEIIPIKQEPRIFRENETIYYDLHDASNPQYVKIDQTGYKIHNGKDFRFRTYETQSSQVTPIPGGSLDLLDKYLNMDSEQRELLKVFMISAFIPGFPHPILLIDGEAGSSKTTLSVILKKLIDPSSIESLSMPTTQSDLLLNLDHHYFIPFDNMSGIKQSISDNLCKAITGSGICTRMLYKDDDSFTRYYKRTVLINGINVGTLKEDFLDRCLSFHLTRIDDKNRKPLMDIEKEFEKDRPLILGAIFDAVSKALEILPTVNLQNLSRMADFEKYGYACSEALGEHKGDQFIESYHKCVKEQKERAVADNPILAAITLFMRNKTDWKGNMTEFLAEFSRFSKENSLEYIEKKLPDPSVLGRKLTDYKALLTDQGLHIEEVSKGGKGNLWQFSKIETE